MLFLHLTHFVCATELHCQLGMFLIMKILLYNVCKPNIFLPFRCVLFLLLCFVSCIANYYESNNENIVP